MSLLVRAVPSYTLLAVADPKVTVLFSIVRLPSVTTNVTFAKSVLLFTKSDSFSPIGYVPASFFVTLSVPLNVKSDA